MFNKTMKTEELLYLVHVGQSRERELQDLGFFGCMRVVSTQCHYGRVCAMSLSSI